MVENLNQEKYNKSKIKSKKNSFIKIYKSLSFNFKRNLNRQH